MKVFLFLVLVEPALAADGESIVLNADIDVFFVNAGHFDFQSDVVFVFVDIHRRCETAGRQRLFRALGGERLTENTVHTVLQCGKITTCQNCHTTTPFSEISGGRLGGACGPTKAGSNRLIDCSYLSRSRFDDLNPNYLNEHRYVLCKTAHEATKRRSFAKGR